MSSSYLKTDDVPPYQSVGSLPGIHVGDAMCNVTNFDKLVGTARLLFYQILHLKYIYQVLPFLAESQLSTVTS